MAQVMAAAREASDRDRDRSVKILAKSIFRDLKQNGYDARAIVALSSELIGLVTSEIKPEGKGSDEGGDGR